MLNFSINYYVFNQDITILNLVKKNIHCIKFFNIYIFSVEKKQFLGILLNQKNLLHLRSTVPNPMGQHMSQISVQSIHTLHDQNNKYSIPEVP